MYIKNVTPWAYCFSTLYAGKLWESGATWCKSLQTWPFVKAAAGLGCFVNRQRPAQGLTLVQEFLSASKTLSSVLVLYTVKWTEH
jgi:hypothetical protein